jgi:hypothetical protein
MSTAIDDLPDTLACAEDARTSVAALIELLRGCPPEHKLSAGLFVGLLVSVQCNLDNVVDGVSVAAGIPRVLTMHGANSLQLLM